MARWRSLWLGSRQMGGNLALLLLSLLAGGLRRRKARNATPPLRR